MKQCSLLKQGKIYGRLKDLYHGTITPEQLALLSDEQIRNVGTSSAKVNYDCVSIYNEANNTDIHEIIVICHKDDCPQDMKSSNLHGYLGSYAYQDMMYYYWDIFEWIASMLQRMTNDGRLGFYLELNGYIDDINTSETVKRLWKTLHEGA